MDVNGEPGKTGGSAPQATGNSLDHFCLQIEPFEEQKLQNYLHQHGVEIDEFQDRYGAQGMGRSIYLRDIAGNNIELRSSK